MGHERGTEASGPSDVRIYDVLALLHEMPGYGASEMLGDGSLLLHWAGEHPASLAALIADAERGFDLRVEPCPYSEVELLDAMHRLCDAVDGDARLLGDRQMPVVGPETDASGLFAEVIDPTPETARTAAHIAGVPVRIVPVTHGPTLI